MIHPITHILSEIKHSEEKISEAETAKADLVQFLVDEIVIVSNIFTQLWLDNKELIQEQVKEIANRCGYALPYHKKMSLDYFMDKISSDFPIYNDCQNLIVENLPEVNSKWEINNKSSGPDIILEILPCDAYSRYSDTENNVNAFTYKIPGFLPSSFNQDNPVPGDERKKLITIFFNNAIVQELEVIENLIKEELSNIENKLNAINFSNPATLEALKNRINKL